jgi:CRP-like cAMP-binding protein
MTLKSYRNLTKYSYFSHLTDDSLEQLSKRISTVHFPAGSELIGNGAISDAFYLLETGDIEILKKSDNGNVIKISLTGNSDEIGVMPLLTRSPRYLSVTAKSDIKLHKILQNDFEDMVCIEVALSEISGKKSSAPTNFKNMKAFHPLTLVAPEKMIVLANKFQEVRYPANQDIIKQGEEGENYFIIKSGSVDVLKLMFEDEPEHVAILEPGQGFGEEALITGQKRNATVRAREETIVLVLNKHDFESIMKESFLQEVSPEEVIYSKNGETLLDVRFDIEFEESHIPGAMLIPLDEIRNRYAELDYNKNYFVYCRSGRRSASATFLLRNQGFNAVNIKGGITVWPGEVVEGM